MATVMENKVSIIVPVYNAESYLDKCISSLVKQTGVAIEIILIDDGSVDASKIICETWQGKYPELIKFVSIENGGVSHARNIGLSLATGTHVQFVDSDDYILDGYCAKLMEFCDEDLVISGIVFNPPKIAVEPPETHGTLEHLRKNIYSYIYPENIIFSPWNKLYSLSIIKKHNIYFQEDIRIGEDALFNINYMKEIKSYRIISSSFYVYNLANSQSAMKRKDESWFWADIHIYSELNAFTNNMCTKKEFERYKLDLVDKIFKRLIFLESDNTIIHEIKRRRDLVERVSQLQIDIPYQKLRGYVKLMYILTVRKKNYTVAISSYICERIYEMKSYVFSHFARRSAS